MIESQRSALAEDLNAVIEKVFAKHNVESDAEAHTESVIDVLTEEGALD